MRIKFSGALISISSAASAESSVTSAVNPLFSNNREENLKSGQRSGENNLN